MIPQAQKQQMAEAVAHIRETMAAAARAAGRDPAQVKLCAACKTRTVEEVRCSADLPIDLFGENHVQELVEKTDAGAYNGKPGHFIGHLQTNKVNKVVGRAALIQSVDSTRLLDKIDTAAARLGLVQDILVEINIGEETSKSGVDADSLFPLLEAAAAKENLRVPPSSVWAPPFTAHAITAKRHNCRTKRFGFCGGLLMWFVFALLSAVFAALTSILAKIGIEGVASNLATAIRTVVVLVMSWGMVFLTNTQGGITGISRKSWLFLILSGLATGASWLCYYRALQIGDASKVVPIDKLSVVITLVLAFVFLHEQFTVKSLLGCALIGAGTLLMVL